MTSQFNTEIMNYKIIKKIRSYFDSLLEDGYLWNTPYGTFSYYKDDIINNIWLGHIYNVSIKRFENYILFSIIPYNINNIISYDGFICSYENITNIPNDIINKYLLSAYIFDSIIKNDQFILYIR